MSNEQARTQVNELIEKGVRQKYIADQSIILANNFNAWLKGNRDMRDENVRKVYDAIKTIKKDIASL